MTFTEAAAEVLRIAGKPLHYKEITELAIEKNLLSHVGKSPEVTMGARLAALLKKEDKTNPIVRVKPGVFALAEWAGKKKKRGGAEAATDDLDSEDSEGTEVNALEVEAQNDARRAEASVDDDDDEPLIVSGEDALRADLAASGAELYEDEDDDDQPILSGPSSSNDVVRGGSSGGSGAGAGAGAAAGDVGADGSRRRRRRRRRRGGRDGGPEEQRTSSPRVDIIQPNAIVSVENDS